MIGVSGQRVAKIALQYATQPMKISIDCRIVEVECFPEQAQAIPGVASRPRMREATSPGRASMIAR